MCVRQRRRWSPVHAGKTQAGSGFTDTSKTWMVGYEVGNALSGVSAEFRLGFGEVNARRRGVAGQNIGGLLARH